MFGCNLIIPGWRSGLPWSGKRVGEPASTQAAYWPFLPQIISWGETGVWWEAIDLPAYKYWGPGNWLVYFSLGREPLNPWRAAVQTHWTLPRPGSLLSRLKYRFEIKKAKKVEKFLFLASQKLSSSSIFVYLGPWCRKTRAIGRTSDIQRTASINYVMAYVLTPLWPAG